MFHWVARVRDLAGASVASGRSADGLIARADAARDAKNYREAAALYAKALRLAPENTAIHVQCGHMYKEAGDLARAERHYLRAGEQAPDDADLAFQLGHFYKVAGRWKDSEAAYRRALTIAPDWPDPAIELGDLFQKGWRGDGKAGPAAGRSIVTEGIATGTSVVAGLPSTVSRIVPELVPRTGDQLLHENGDSIHVRQMGRRERSHWGVLRTLRGVEAIRGICLSSIPIVSLQIALDGHLVNASVPESHPAKNERANPDLRKYVFNVWHDFSTLRAGRYEIELRFLDALQGMRVHREPIVIQTPLSETEFPASDGLVPPADPEDGRALEDQVNTRPSIVRAAKRTFFAEPPRKVLIQRTDQLGDMVISIPALRRLREILPDAHLVGLLTAANADLARTLGLFDEIIVVEFPDDPIQRRRVMTAENQEELRRKLATYKFDVAMDLAPAGESRPLLLLSGAPFLYGFGDRDWPWLSAGLDFNTHDRVDRLDNMPASAKTMGLIEAFGAIVRSHAKIVRRPDLSRDRLAAFGIGTDDRYAILHTGARVVFSRWPHYDALAGMILARTDLKIVMLSENPATRASIPAELMSSNRFQLLDKRLAFDDFDALLSYCAVFVGNDSGPKHLASLRGANVVSLHTPRINWAEWGQEMVGSIISRKVPCAGCMVYHDPEECGKDYACINNISAEEVFGAVAALV